MAKKKYVRDYEISETIDEKGRVRSVPIYVGSYFCFCDAAAAKKSGRLLAPAAALGWLAYIMALWLPSGAGKLMYVILPFVFAAVPLWYVSSAVAALLRAGISGDRLITLERELELLEKYLDIQSLRFEDRFAWEIDVDERFQHCIVPKLILQPLVENSIIHGVANMDDGYIKLSAREKSGTLILSVQDNGVGIPQDVLDWLNDPDRDVPGGHLGLKNVDRIVRLYYGGDYGISAYSAVGEGSRVELRLPMNKEGNGNAEGSGR